MTLRLGIRVLVALYVFAIAAANLLAARFGPDITILNAFLFIALDLSTRDRLHEKWRGRHLWRNMALLILGGGVLAALFNLSALPIAFASLCAFVAAGVVDALIYTLLYASPRLVRMNMSNLFGAIVDSFIFLLLVFGMFPEFWRTFSFQVAAKCAGGALWAYVLTRKWNRLS